MTTDTRAGDLEIEHDIRFQRRAWRAQRVTLGALLLLMATAFTGALGGRGPLADRTITSPGDSLRLDYKRLARHHAPSLLTVYFGPGLAQISDSTVTLWLDREYVKWLAIAQIDPEPESALASQDRVTYEFKVSDPQKPSTVMFKVIPTRSGTRTGSIGVEGGPSFSFPQFVFP